jgi:DNA-binding transcriptional LysR family regulator
MTQPPLSRQIQRLEASIGVRLLERNNRRVELTPAGRAFLAEARRLVALADAAPQVARTVAAGSTGVLRLGVTASGAYGLLGVVLTRLAESLPDVTVQLHEMVTREQLAALAADEIDVALGRPGSGPFDFASRLIHREGLVVALPAGHRLARLRRPLTPDELEGESLIMHSPTDAQYFYDLVVRMLPISRWHYSHTVTQVITMVSLVASGRGIALVPESAVMLGLRGVVFAPVTTPDPYPVQMHVIWRTDEQRPLVTRSLEALDFRLSGQIVDAGRASDDA